jgi:dTDP-4-dehydrorhamnose 3,5-epimerase
MEVLPTKIEGVLLLRPKVAADERGNLIKSYHRPTFEKLGLEFARAEEFYSVSKRNVIRGMHLQLPPFAYHKCVFCIAGAVLDVVLDLRRQSSTYGMTLVRELNSNNHEMLMIPFGCAHGFAVLSDEATMLYQTDTIHSPSHDGGVRWDSFGLVWPVAEPIVSERDRALPAFSDFVTPF